MERPPESSAICAFRFCFLIEVAVTTLQAGNSTIAPLTRHLLWLGGAPEVAPELMRAWIRLRCRPPLDDAEVARVCAISSGCTRTIERGQRGAATGPVASGVGFSG